MAVTVTPELEKKFNEEKIVWLSTVRSDGLPQPTPVWFLWQGGEFVIYSEPGVKKIRNIESNPRVALHFDTDAWGNHVVVVTGRASVENDATPLNEIPTYVEKYREGMDQLEMTPESMAKDYSTAIRVKPGWIRNEHA